MLATICLLKNISIELTAANNWGSLLVKQPAYGDMNGLFI